MNNVHMYKEKEIIMVSAYWFPCYTSSNYVKVFTIHPLFFYSEHEFYVCICIYTLVNWDSKMLEAWSMTHGS